MVLFILGIGITLIGIVSPIYYPAIEPYAMYILWLGIALIVFPLLFQLYKYLSKNRVAFEDDFGSFNGWVNIPPGGVCLDTLQYHTGASSLKKYGANDPSGGYKKFAHKLRRGFIFSGWIYRPINFEGGAGDRLAVEDNKGNGYGFSIVHGQRFVAIEKRNELSSENLQGLQFTGDFHIPQDDWYYFEFQLTSKGIIDFRIDYNGNRVSLISIQDKSYKRFNRIAIHGGYPYYIDDLRIIST